MASILIKNLPRDLHQRLKQRARRNRRSMSAEAIVILEGVLGGMPRQWTLEEIDALRVRPRKPVTGEFVERAKRAGRR
jgi:plasmid stability protein